MSKISTKRLWCARFAVSVGVLALLGVTGHAATVVWTNSTGGSWSTAANWNPNLVPTIADDVTISIDGDYVVTVPVNAGAMSLALGGGNGIQSLSIEGATFTLGGPAQVHSNAVLTLAGGCLAGNKLVTVDGAMQWTGGTNAVKVTISTNGWLDIFGGNTKYYNNATVTNYGTANWRDTGCQMYLGTVVFNNYGTYYAVATTDDGCPVVAKIKLTNYGIVNAVTTDAMLHEWAHAVTWKNHGVLNFVELTSFTEHPASQHVVSGSDVTLKVGVQGVSPFTYQWFRNGVAVVGATDRELKLDDVQSEPAGIYFATVSNVVQVVTSSNASLIVDVPPVILQQPVSWTANEGQPSSVSVVATGNQLTYQWRRENQTIAGATNASLMFPSISGADEGKYKVNISSGVATVTSAEAELTVIIKPAITEQPASKDVSLGSTVTLTVKASGTAPFSYLWLKDGVPLPGVASSSLTLNNASAAHAGSYAAVVANGAGSVTSQPASIAIKVPPVIMTQPVGQSVSVGSNVVLAVTATGVPTPTCQWRKNGVTILGATSATLLLTNVQPAHSGDYSVVVANSEGAVESAPARLTVSVPELLFTDAFSPRGLLYSAAGFGHGTNVGATKELGEPSHAGKGSATKTVWISWWAPANGIATFSTAGSDFDTVMGVYRGTAVNALNKVASDDDSAGFHCSKVSFNAIAGTYYQIAVAGDGAAAGNIILNWDLNITAELLPEITQAPLDITGNTNDTVALQVVFSVFEPTAIQWFFQGQTLVGATNTTYVIASLQDDMVGGYAVRLTGASGRNVVSPPGDLQINTEGVTEASARNKFFDAAERALTP